MDNQEFIQFKENMLAAATSHNYLVAATIELTNICNFKCHHCYLGDREHNTLDVVLVKRFLDELKEQGCIMLLLTGGEPLLHPHFKEIYIYAKQKGFIITVFTNGSMLSKEYIELFLLYKPYLIEVSLYGIDVDSYVAFTGVKDSYYKVKSSLNLMAENHISFRLKTMLMKQTLPYIQGMEQLAKIYDVQFRWDSYIVPTLNGDINVLENHLLDEETICTAILSNNDLRTIVKNKLESTVLNDEQAIQRLYFCDAGRTNVFISSDAKMSLCVIAREPFYDLIKGTIKNGRQVLYEYSEQPMPVDYKCKGCKRIQFCRYCPSKFKLESGSIAPVERYCRIAERLYNALQVEI
ncbi:MAG: radical SAM protein [Oscillospiraceae bacterium]|jgi:MoaA/NifB/PqqE/SkfB family radical SAM enzyme|nr:radical SAM protein [Oscillospiraceae bacterium]